MNVLVLGSGGREHAISWKLAQSKKVDKIFIGPGNAGTRNVGNNIPVDLDDFESIKMIVIENEIVGAFTSDDAHLLEVIGPYIASVIEVALLHQKAKTAALHDSLTGVYNHRYFYERLEQELTRSRRHDHPRSVAIIDVDELKRVNDLYGHLIGDQALKRMGHILKENVGASDVVARYGGDEFAIIMPETEKEVAERVLHRLMLLLDAAVIEYDASSVLMPSRSYWLATFPGDGNNPTELFASADAILYQVKAKRARQKEHSAS